ncbi:MAG: hypothetical protein ACYCZN_03335 [Candidatus Dormibacteria bacterium]
MFLPLSIWLLVTPYGHPNNAILLLPLVILVMGPDARALMRSARQVALLGMFILITELFTGTILFTDLMPVATLVLLLAAARTLHMSRAAGLTGSTLA